MASRPSIAPFKVIKDEDMSGNLISTPTIIDNESMVSYQVSWDGAAPVGDISVQVSNDYKAGANGVINAGTWTTLTLSAPTAVSGNTGSGFIDVTQTGAYAIRLVYTRSSGTGTMQATVVAKVA